MAVSSTSWKKGHSGNPAGISRITTTSRYLSRLLQEVGAQPCPDGERTNAELLADLVWQGVTTGEVRFPIQGDNLMVLGVQRWLEMVKFIYGQVDGPPKAEMDLNIKEQAEKIAKQYGVNAEELIKAAEEIVAEAQGK